MQCYSKKISLPRQITGKSDPIIWSLSMNGERFGFHPTCRKRVATTALAEESHVEYIGKITYTASSRSYIYTAKP